MVMMDTPTGPASGPSQLAQLLEWRVLKAIAESEGLLGSVRLQGLLLKQGYTLSQTTVGRALTHLDLLGYTTTPGPKQGRHLTPRGEERLRELGAALDWQENERQLLEALRVRSAPDILDALRVRAAVEGEAARLVAEHATQAQVKELHALLERVRELLDAGEHPLEANRQFHLKIAEYSGNRVLLSVLRFLMRNPTHLRLPASVEPSNLATSLEEHRDILDAIAAADPDLAEQLMQAHHRRTEKMLEEYIAQLGSGELAASASN
ncbi:MAG: FadR/GntR family transcriptional regulator [Chloroflexota bacterium]